MGPRRFRQRQEAGVNEFHQETELLELA